MIEIKAKLKNVRISARKIRLVADAIRGLSVPQALAKLQVVFKKSVPVIDKLLRSAVANAKDRYEVKEDDLFVKRITVNQAMAFKRFQPAAFGSAHPYKKHAAHIEIVLSIKEGISVKARDKKVEAIETVDLTKTEKKKESVSVKKEDDKKEVKAKQLKSQPEADKE